MPEPAWGSEAYWEREAREWGDVQPWKSVLAALDATRAELAIVEGVNEQLCGQLTRLTAERDEARAELATKEQ